MREGSLDQPVSPSRRKFLGLLGAAGAVAFLESRTGLLRKSLEWFSKRPTEEQEKGKELLASANEADFVHNIKALGEEEDGKVIPVNLRAKPAVPVTIGPPDSKGGAVIGTLEPGRIIKRARVVWGSEPQPSQYSGRYDRWFVFEDPDYPGRTVFSWRWNFEADDQELAKIEPVDIQHRLPQKPSLKINPKR